MSVSLTLKNISRSYVKDNEKFYAVQNVNLEVQPGEFLTFLGPSGCGRVGRYDNRLTRLVSAPGMWLQNWTTFEPDDSMIEVGIRAFTLVLPEEKGKDQW